MPKISVLMPVYNTEEEYLREAIESILSQDFEDFEFLIINDGSQNNAEKVILSYEDERIKYHKNEKNLGLIDTLNKGLELATGEYIARMDSDDVSLPERFKKQVAFLDENSDVDVLGTWFNCFPRNRVIKSFTNDKDIKECLLVNSNIIGHPTVMFRRTIMDRFGAKYDKKAIYAEDYALWLSLLDKVKFANIPEILLNYRIHDKNVSKTNAVKQCLIAKKQMVIAQGKYFNINSKPMTDLINRLENEEEILLEDILIINNFATLVKEKMKAQNFGCKYDIERNFYKYAIKKCKKKLRFFNPLLINKPKRAQKVKSCNSFASKAYDKPKISAVMALYKTPINFLKKTVNSVLNQTFSDFELIIIDDASDFDYAPFFNQFNDSRIKYFKLEKNVGPGGARNEGIKKSTGEYVAVVDSDDVYFPFRFELQSNFLDENEDIDLISGGFEQSNNKKRPPVVENDDDIKVYLLFNSPIPNPLVMFRRKVFVENGLFYSQDIKFAEDYELWVRAIFNNLKFANIKDVLMIYVRRKNQLSKMKNDKQVSILKDIYRVMFENLGIKATPQELDLHYSIYKNEFKKDTDVSAVEKWFDKIIENNKKEKFFSEDKLIQKKNDIVEKILNIQNRVLKIKINNYDMCVLKPFRITLIKRDNQ